MSDAVTLGERLDYSSITPLVDKLSTYEGDKLVIDAGGVKHLGALALQVILTSVKSRAEAGKETVFQSASDACVDQLALFGFSPETLTNPEAWT